MAIIVSVSIPLDWRKHTTLKNKIDFLASIRLLRMDVFVDRLTADELRRLLTIFNLTAATWIHKYSIMVVKLGGRCVTTKNKARFLVWSFRWIWSKVMAIENAQTTKHIGNIRPLGTNHLCLNGNRMLKNLSKTKANSDQTLAVLAM